MWYMKMFIFLSWENKDRERDKTHRDIKPDQLESTKITTRNKTGQPHYLMGYKETAGKPRLCNRWGCKPEGPACRMESVGLRQLRRQWKGEQVEQRGGKAERDMTGAVWKTGRVSMLVWLSPAPGYGSLSCHLTSSY